MNRTRNHYTEEEIINKFASVKKSTVRECLNDPSVFSFKRHNGVRVYRLTDVLEVLEGVLHGN